MLSCLSWLGLRTFLRTLLGFIAAIDNKWSQNTHEISPPGFRYVVSSKDVSFWKKKEKKKAIFNYSHAHDLRHWLMPFDLRFTPISQEFILNSSLSPSFLTNKDLGMCLLPLDWHRNRYECIYLLSQEIWDRLDKCIHLQRDKIRISESRNIRERKYQTKSCVNQLHDTRAANLALSFITGKGKERNIILRVTGSKSYEEAQLFWVLSPERNLSPGSS